LALPYADTDMMQLHLGEISSNVAKGAYAVVLPYRAGWHITSKLDMPENITPIFLPSRAPELNPVENVSQYLRQNRISNTVFENYDAIVDAACDAWRKLTAKPEIITSIGMRDCPRRPVAMTFGIRRRDAGPKNGTGGPRSQRHPYCRKSTSRLTDRKR
jgi:hypothetical protein